MTHDFDAALKHVEEVIKSYPPDTHGLAYCKEHYDLCSSIQFALKFTKAALSGEVSEEVMKAATDSYAINGRFALLSHYKAMSQQLAKEIG